MFVPRYGRFPGEALDLVFLLNHLFVHDVFGEMICIIIFLLLKIVPTSLVTSLTKKKGAFAHHAFSTSHFMKK